MSSIALYLRIYMHYFPKVAVMNVRAVQQYCYTHRREYEGVV